MRPAVTGVSNVVLRRYGIACTDGKTSDILLHDLALIPCNPAALIVQILWEGAVQ